jgi:hypothetical protein
MDDIVNLFRTEHGFYNRMFKFEVIIIFIIIIFFLTKLNLFNNSIYVLISVIIGLYLTNMYIKLTQSDLNDVNKIIYFKLESLQSKVYDYIQYKISTASVNNQKIPQADIKKLYDKNKLDALYIDADIIVFLYSVIKLYDYNPSEYYLLLKGTNNILKLRNDIEKLYEAENKYPENIHEMLQVALQLKSNCLNNLQNFIYTVPKTNKMYEYIDNVIVSYSNLITKNIKIIHQYHLNYIKQNGINSNTIFIDIDSPKSYDSLTNYSIIPNKQGLKHSLIDLYA